VILNNLKKHIGIEGNIGTLYSQVLLNFNIELGTQYAEIVLEAKSIQRVTVQL